MRRHATATSSGPNERKPSGLGSNPPSSRLRLAILLATVAAFLLVPAAQAFAVQTAKVSIKGSGSGEVKSFVAFGEWGVGTPQMACSYNGTSKSGTCENKPAESEPGSGYYVIGLEAHPAAGSTLAGWSGMKPAQEFECPLGTLHPERCYLSSAEEEESLEVTATFCLEGEVANKEGNCKPGESLTIAKTGEGTIASNPAGIECTGAKTGAQCEHAFALGETVTITASPATGYAFNSWAGCTTHVGLTCTVEMSKAKTVKASFIATPSLTIEKTGSGQGKAAATGISCDENCSKATSAVKAGTSVTVKVAPAKGSEAAVFEGGTGSASGCSGASCTFTISENSSVKVKFAAIPTKTMTVILTGPAAYKGKVSGKGIVKGLTGSAISCGTGCTTQTESFFSTDEVTLSAAAGTGYTFGGWNVSGGSVGTCTGTTTPCTVKTDADKTISAEFK